MEESSELQEVEERLEAVENQSRHLLLTGLAVAGFLGVVFVMWQARQRRRVAAVPRARSRPRRLRSVPPPTASVSRGTVAKGRTSPRRKRTR